MKKSSLKAKSLFGQSKTVRKKVCNKRIMIASVYLKDNQLDKVDRIKKKYGVTVSHILRTLIDSLE